MAERLTRVAVATRAADLADEIGLHQLTITKVGRALGIAPPGVYRHVKDLDDLHSAISVVAYEEAAEILAHACAGYSGSEALSALGVAMRGWAHDHPGRYAALQVAPNDDEGREAAEPVLAVIAAALREYRLEDDELTDAIRFVRSTLHGFISLELGGGFKQERDITASFERTIAMIDTALSST